MFSKLKAKYERYKLYHYAWNDDLKRRLQERGIHPKTPMTQDEILTVLEDGDEDIAKLKRVNKERREKELKYIKLIAYYKTKYRADEWEDILFRDLAEANNHLYRGGMIDIPLLRRVIRDTETGFTEERRVDVPPERLSPLKETIEIIKTTMAYDTNERK